MVASFTVKVNVLRGLERVTDLVKVPSPVMVPPLPDAVTMISNVALSSHPLGFDICMADAEQVGAAGHGGGGSVKTTSHTAEHVLVCPQASVTLTVTVPVAVPGVARVSDRSPVGEPCVTCPCPPLTETNTRTFTVSPVSCSVKCCNVRLHVGAEARAGKVTRPDAVAVSSRHDPQITRLLNEYPGLARVTCCDVSAPVPLHVPQADGAEARAVTVAESSQAPGDGSVTEMDAEVQPAHGSIHVARHPSVSLARVPQSSSIVTLAVRLDDPPDEQA